MLAGCGMLNRTAPHAAQGMLDLRGWDFGQKGPVGLDGEWEWYWNQILDPGKPPPEGAHKFFSVPQVWNGKVVDGHVLSGQGFATFRLRLFLRPNVRYGLSTRFCSGAF